MNDDLIELLESLKSHGVKFLVVGGHAVSFHARPRMTEDIDLWVGRDTENVERLAVALKEFGAPIGDAGAKTFETVDRQMVRLGVPPAMVDVLNFAGDEPFEKVWSRRVTGQLAGVEVAFPSKEDLVAIKRAAGRPQDLADIKALEKS